MQQRRNMDLEMSEMRSRKHSGDFQEQRLVEFADEPEEHVVTKLFSGCLLSKNEVSTNGEKQRYGPAPIADHLSGSGRQSTSLAGSLDSSLAENGMVELDLEATSTSRAGSSGYINYFSKLALSDRNEKIDVDFVDSLIRGGANVNARDKCGQTIMFEIVRQWTTDAADFALSRGVDIMATDNFGRTPLHLASALDLPDMVTWLLEHGCNIHARTKGEEQTPIHYAAKSNAIRALKILLGRGARVEDRDFKQRTALHLAAEQGRSKAAHFLVQVDAPVGVYDDCGTAAISVMANKMPDIANSALQQFITHEQSSRKTFYHLNYLETVTWRDLAMKKSLPMRNGVVLTLLEVLVKYNELGLIMHPVIHRLIHMKWKQFGKWRSIQQVLLNTFYTLLWTSLAVTLPSGKPYFYYVPIKDNIWRVILEFIGCSMTLYFVVTQILDFRNSKRRNLSYVKSRISELERELQYCHPRWPEEKRYVTSEAFSVRSASTSYLKDMWNIFEWITFSGIVFLVATRLAAAISKDDLADDIHIRAFPIVLILIWLRMMKYFRTFHTLGPFITMLGHVIDATLKFCFLFFEIFIPYICAFWVLFGGVEDYTTVSDVTYQVFLMTLVGDYSFAPLVARDKIMAQVLVGTYVALAAVVCLNLYIALMSETFTRVFSNATANAYMLQARQLLDIEESLPASKRSKNHKDLLKNYSPEVVYTFEQMDLSETSQLSELRNSTNELLLQMENVMDICTENSKTIVKLSNQCNVLSKSVDSGSAFQNRTLGRMKKTLKRLHDTNAQQIIKRGLGLESDDSSDDQNEAGVVRRMAASSVANLKQMKDKLTTKIKATFSEDDKPEESDDALTMPEDRRSRKY